MRHAHTLWGAYPPPTCSASPWKASHRAFLKEDEDKTNGHRCKASAPIIQSPPSRFPSSYKSQGNHVLDTRPTPLPTKFFFFFFFPSRHTTCVPTVQGDGNVQQLVGTGRLLASVPRGGVRRAPAPSFPRRCNIPVPACGRQEHGGCPKPTREGRRGQTPDPPRQGGKKKAIKSSQFTPPIPPRNPHLPPRKRAAFRTHGKDAKSRPTCPSPPCIRVHPRPPPLRGCTLGLTENFLLRVLAARGG